MSTTTDAATSTVAVAPGAVRLSARGVTVTPHGAGRPVLADAGIDVRAGELHALVGPNGAGKSTMFGVLAGDVTPDSGDVSLDGTPLGSIRPRLLAQRRAVLLQQNAVSFPFTVEQVVRMGRAPWARTPAEDDDDAAVARALEVTDLTPLAGRGITSLSGGERARAALARVLAQGCDVLLLDEPTAALDLKHQEDVLRIARDRAQEGAAVAVVLHDLNAAVGVADRVTLLSRGRVVASGAPSEVLTAAAIEEVYGQRVDVFPHPVSGTPVVMPRR
ncbi:iron complex transport system ATP-binding protein [Microbacterium trichothecenolyticum]|uniref:heme ABC transporter ATP-binding protein n=1 Tax=Microbacterium trichothecenolyticum TaxID=69370 RepID=UPI00285BDC0F|nr:heme ABC transporter ATP-binding protein [Microbacterium trichothecenolyticum]MDR7110662.1 iron complex transport system ATP-binding protein [Microbacterium trichothecenolyticum]